MNYLPYEKFKECLKKGNISVQNEAAQRVLDKITKLFPMQMFAVAGDVDACMELYRQAKLYPENTTCGAIENQMNLSINGPISPKILTGLDRETGKRYLIKILRPQDTVTNRPANYVKDSIQIEIEACTTVNLLDCECLVKCEIVNVNVEHIRGLDVSIGCHTALKMRHFFSSLDKVPQMSEILLFNGFKRMVQALKSLHSRDLVHMDIKSDNVFCDDETVWFLGDFGSTRKVETAAWSFTEVFNPYKLYHNKTKVIKSMDYVQLCVMIAVELNKEDWKVRLCGNNQRVQQELISNSLSKIDNGEFGQNVQKLFQEHYQLAMEHLKSK